MQSSGKSTKLASIITVKDAGHPQKVLREKKEKQ